MDYQTAIEKIGREPTATFGVAPPEEIVGPLNPRHVHYGVAYGSDPDTGAVMPNHAVPLLFFGFNKYRPDLPQWEKVREIVLAAETDSGGSFEVTFIDPHHNSTSTTGDLKTVTLTAEGPAKGVDAHIITEEKVAEKRGMTTSNVEDGSTFKVTDTLK